MGANDVTFLETGAWLIPLILFATIGGLFWMARYWREKTQQELKQSRSELRRIQNVFRQLVQSSETYSTDDPDPFGSLAKEMRVQLGEVEKDIIQLEQQRVSLQENIYRNNTNPLKAMMGAPFFWRQFRQDMDGLWDYLNQVQNSLTAIEAFEQRLVFIAWEVAQRAKQMRLLLQRVNQLLDQLRVRNVQGEAMEDATQLEQDARLALEEIPQLFLSGDEKTVLEQADQDQIIDVHQILDETFPNLEQLVDQAQAWDEQYQQTAKKTDIMRRVLHDVEQVLSNAPEGLTTEPFTDRLVQLQDIARILEATLARIEIENMTMVANEAEQTARIAHEMESQLRQARSQLANLGEVIVELSNGISKLTLQYAQLESKSVHPITWDKSAATLKDLNLDFNKIGTAQQTRQPEQITEDLASARVLYEQLKNLENHCNKTEHMHGELVSLLSSPEFAQLDDWLRDTQGLSSQVVAYAPENWPRVDGVANFRGELDALKKDAQGLIPTNSAEPIQETAIAQRLEDTRQFSEVYDQLRKRVENIRARLEDLQKTETASREQLEGASSAFNQIVFIVRSNTLLGSIADRDMDRFLDGFQLAKDDLADHKQGNVEKKTKQITAFVARIEMETNHWLDDLNKDIETLVTDISNILTTLDSIAPLDEPSIEEARRLVSSAQTFGVGSYGSKSRYRMDSPGTTGALVSEFKRRSDYWQACSGTFHALQDVEKPIMDTFTQASQDRQYVHELFAEVSTWMRQARSWPPTSASLENEQRELSRTDDQWQSLKRDRTKAINLVAQLGGISAKYQTLAEKIQQVADRAEQDQEQIVEVETALEDSLQMWQGHWHAFRDNPSVTQDISNLVAEVDQDWEKIRDEYRRGKKDFRQVLQALKLLHRRVRYFQVALDNDHALDISGREIARR